MSDKYNILVVGYGYVGKAVAAVFKADTLSIVDPKYFNNKLSDYKNHKFDIVFVCVDTPIDNKFKILDTVLNDINNYLYEGTIVVCKSTASPTFYSKAEKKYKNIKLLHSPEYLSHWNNIEDFKHQEFIIMGGYITAAKKSCKILLNRLKYVKDTRITDIKTAALIKYSENGFLALKVSFANELSNIHKALKCESNFKDFTEMLGLDKRIGKSHMQVPGRDGKYGWGGHCYEKDNQEFLKFSKSKLLKTMIAINKIHRKQT